MHISEYAANLMMKINLMKERDISAIIHSRKNYFLLIHPKIIIMMQRAIYLTLKILKSNLKRKTWILFIKIWIV
jgi:hypothetical protein